MRLLFDENLSPKLAESLDHLFPGSAHVHNCGLGATDDQLVWEYAKTNGFILVSKDRDFYELSLLDGPPPKVIWIRCGNSSTSAIESLLRNNHLEIEGFDSDDQTAFILS
ncbi:MAG: DUF5615 family PIN-like protein [Terrimicrobiaceae bacterium]